MNTYIYLKQDITDENLTIILNANDNKILRQIIKKEINDRKTFEENDDNITKDKQITKIYY